MVIKVSKVSPFNCVLSGLKIFPTIINERSIGAVEAETERQSLTQDILSVWAIKKKMT